MTLNLNNVVSVTSTVQDSAVRAANFGTVALFCYHTNYVGWNTYTADAAGLAQMVTDGFGTYHDAYRKVTAMASQTSGSPTVKIYARTTNDLQSITLTPVETTEGFIYDFDVNGTNITYTVLAAATATSIATALQPLIDAVTGVTAVDNTGSVGITPDDRAVASVYIDSSGPEFTIKDGAADAGIATDYNAAVALDNKFYGVATDAYSEAGIAAIAALVETAGKLCFMQTNDSEVWSAAATDAMSDLQGSSYVRTGLLCTREMSAQPAVGLMNRQFSFNPGSSNWNWQRISGATSDNWTQAEADFITGKNGGIYADYAATGADPTGITTDVKAASGRYLDITRGVDWLDSSLAQAIANELLAREKIPNTAEGRSMIQSAMSAVMKTGERYGLLTSEWTITIPTAAEQSASDKTNRILRDVKYTAVLTGAIDTVLVQGTLTLN